MYALKERRRNKDDVDDDDASHSSLPFLVPSFDVTRKRKRRARRQRPHSVCVELNRPRSGGPAGTKGGRMDDGDDVVQRGDAGGDENAERVSGIPIRRVHSSLHESGESVSSLASSLGNVSTMSSASMSDDDSGGTGENSSGIFRSKSDESTLLARSRSSEALSPDETEGDTGLSGRTRIASPPASESGSPRSSRLKHSASTVAVSDSSQVPRRHSYQTKDNAASSSASTLSKKSMTDQEPPYEGDATVVSSACARVLLMPATDDDGSAAVSSSTFYNCANLIGDATASTQIPGAPAHLMRGMPIQLPSASMDIAHVRDQIMKETGSKSPLDDESTFVNSGRLRLKYIIKASPTDHTDLTPRDPNLMSREKTAYADWHGFRWNLFPSSVIAITTLEKLESHSEVGADDAYSIHIDERGTVTELPPSLENELNLIINHQCNDAISSSLVKAVIVFGVPGRRVRREDGEDAEAGQRVLLAISRYNPDNTGDEYLAIHAVSLSDAMHIFGGSIIACVEIWMLHSSHGSINLTTPHDFKRKSHAASVDVQRRSSINVKVVQARRRWRLRKVWADMFLSIGASDDAERHYTNAIDYMSRNDGNRSDMMWMASALEGLAAAKGVRYLDSTMKKGEGKDCSLLYEIFGHCTEAISMYRLEGLPLLESSLRIKLARWWSTFPPKDPSLMEYWQKATSHLQEVQGLVWKVNASKSENEGTSVRMMLLLDIASAYFDLRCHRKGSIMFLQAASLLPAPWSAPSDGDGSNFGTECSVRRVVAYMKEYNYDAIFDVESMTALDVANRVRSLAAPTFGILTSVEGAAALDEIGDECESGAMGRPSFRWSLLKMTVALRIIATAAAAIPSMGANASGTCVLAWNAITSLLTDDLVMEQIDDETLRWMGSVIRYVTASVDAGTIVDGDGVFGSGKLSSMPKGFSACLLRGIAAVPSPRDIFSRRKSSTVRNPFIVGVAKKSASSGSGKAAVYWVQNETAAVRVDLAPIREIEMDIRWMQVLIASVDGDEAAVDCHVLELDTRSWEPEREYVVNLTCVPRACGTYAVSGVCYGVGNFTLVHKIDARCGDDAIPQIISVVEKADVQVSVNGTGILDSSGNSEGASIQLAPIQGLAHDAPFIPTARNVISMRNSSSRAVDRMRIEFKVDALKAASITDGMRDYALCCTRAAQASVDECLPLAPAEDDPSALMTIDISDIPFATAGDDVDFTMALKVEYGLEPEASGEETGAPASSDVLFRSQYRIKTQIVGRLRVAFEGVHVLDKCSENAADCTAEDSFLCTFRVANGLQDAVTIHIRNTESDEKRVADDDGSYVQPGGAVTVALPVKASLCSGGASFDAVSQALLCAIQSHAIVYRSVGFGQWANETYIPLASIKTSSDSSKNSKSAVADCGTFISRELIATLFGGAHHIPTAPIHTDGTCGVIGFLEFEPDSDAPPSPSGVLKVVKLRVKLINVLPTASGPFDFCVDSSFDDRMGTASSPSTGNSDKRAVETPAVLMMGQTRHRMSLSAGASHTSAVAAALSRSGKYTFRIAIRRADVDLGPESGASMRRQCTGHRSLTVTL